MWTNVLNVKQVLSQAHAHTAKKKQTSWTSSINENGTTKKKKKRNTKTSPTRTQYYLPWFLPYVKKKKPHEINKNKNRRSVVAAGRWIFFRFILSLCVCVRALEFSFWLLFFSFCVSCWKIKINKQPKKKGDVWGEIDTRFSYCGLSCLALLGKLDAINVKAATDFVARCRNFDGGFGSVPGAESHSGQSYKKKIQNRKKKY